MAIHAMLTARDFSSLLISTLLVHSSAFFSKPLLIFPVLAVAFTWFLCKACRIKQVTLPDAGSCVECPWNINRLKNLMTYEMNNLVIE